MYDIKCFDAFKRAFRRMTRILFHPFAVSKWFVLGFCAWLTIIFYSQSGSGGVGGGFYFKFSNSSNLPYVVSRIGSFLKDVFLGDVFFIGKICNYFKIEQSVFWLFVFGSAVSLLIMLVINLIFVWVSSRFKFIFIDNIAKNSAEIREPWKLFKERGDSAFWWLLKFVVICILFMSIIFIVASTMLYPVMQDFLKTKVLIISDFNSFLLVLTIAVFVSGMVILSFRYYFFNEFVLPIIYKKNLRAKAAYKDFLKLFMATPWTFIKFWLLQILANIACGIAVILFIIATCGIAAVPMLIPYFGVLVILPVFVFHRAQSMELLAAFGTEYSPYPADKK